MAVTISELASGLNRSKPYIRKLLKSGTDKFPPLWEEHVDTSGRTFLVDSYAVQVISDFVASVPPFRSDSVDGSDHSNLDASGAIARDREVSMLREEIARLNAALERSSAELSRVDADLERKAEEIAGLKAELRDERARNDALREVKSEQADTIARLRGELVGVERAGLLQRLRGFSFVGLLADGSK